MTQTVEMDGSRGEGGGQVLRSSLSLAMITGRPLLMSNIRARRRKPGLRQQHLTAVRAATRICGAECQGDSVGSQQLSFTPGELQAGSYRFAVGTAGSACLVLQTVLPALLYAPGSTSLTLEGGTHNPMAPTFDYLERVFAPLLRRMGARLELRLERHGFFPAGGGRIAATVQPGGLLPLRLIQRGAPVSREARVLLGDLPAHIARRELKVVQQKLGWSDAELTVELLEGTGPGNVLQLCMEFDDVAEMTCSFGQRGVPAETVARKAVSAARSYLDSAVPVGRHLADQLLLPLALAGGGEFRTLPLSMHTRTNMEVIGRFLELSLQAEEQADGSVLVRAGG